MSEAGTVAATTFPSARVHDRTNRLSVTLMNLRLCQRRSCA